MTLRDEFVMRIAEEQKTLDFFEQTGTEAWHAEGLGPWVNETGAIIEESKRRIDMYKSLIARIDENSGG